MLETLRKLRRDRRARRLGHAVVMTGLAAAAAGLGVFLGGGANADVGPFETSVSLEPSFNGESEVALPPLGSLIFDSHSGPLRISIQLDSLDQDRTAALVADPDGVRAASTSVPLDLLDAVLNVALSAIAAALLAGLILGGLAYRSMRRAAVCGGISLLLAVASLGMAASTVRPESVAEPRYEGVLANAPAVMGSAQTIADNYEQYQAQLQQFIANMSEFYTLARTLPAYEPDPNTIRALHVSDLHLNPGAWDVIASVVRQFQIDVVVDTGDITDWGSEQEAELYATDAIKVPAPYVYVRGNHDSMETQEALAEVPNVTVLDDEVTEVAGLRIGGIGDPRFTPDKTSQPSDGREAQLLYEAGATLRDTVEAAGGADLAMVHDPAYAQPLTGAVPLILAGHRHQQQVEVMDEETLLLVEGSTGGAGLRGLQGEEPVPLQLSVLYFDGESKVLQNIDQISLGGAGETEVTLQRHVLEDGLPPEGSDLLPDPDEPNPQASLEPDD